MNTPLVVSQYENHRETLSAFQRNYYDARQWEVHDTNRSNGQSLLRGDVAECVDYCNLLKEAGSKVIICHRHKRVYGAFPVLV